MRKVFVSWIILVSLFAAGGASAGWLPLVGAGGGGGGGSCSPPLLSCVTVPSGLVGWWPLDTSTTSGTSTNDLSGNGFTGTLVNSPTTGVTGQIQQAFTFATSSSQAVEMSGTTTGALDLTGSMSITAWFKNTSNGSSQNIVSKGFDGTNTQYQLIIDNGNKVHFETYNGAGHGVISLCRTLG